MVPPTSGSTAPLLVADGSGQPRDFVQSLERGLAVIRTLSAERPSLSVSEIAREVQLTRAAVRRFLLTIERLGYVRGNNNRFALTPHFSNSATRTRASVRVALASPEPEEGRVAVAVPVRDSTGGVRAAINLSPHIGRKVVKQMPGLVPALQTATAGIELVLQHSGTWVD